MANGLVRLCTACAPRLQEDMLTEEERQRRRELEALSKEGTVEIETFPTIGHKVCVCCVLCVVCCALCVLCFVADCVCVCVCVCQDTRPKARTTSAAPGGLVKDGDVAAPPKCLRAAGAALRPGV